MLVCIKILPTDFAYGSSQHFKQPTLQTKKSFKKQAIFASAHAQRIERSGHSIKTLNFSAYERILSILVQTV